MFLNSHFTLKKILFPVIFLLVVIASRAIAVDSLQLDLIVSDAVGMPNEQNVEIAVYMKNYTDTIAAFQIWIQIDRPDIISIVEDFDTTGTLISGWQYVEAATLGAPGTDILFVGVANMYWPPYVPGIEYPQIGKDPLIKFNVNVLDIPDFIVDREVIMSINTDFIDNFGFSDPNGNLIGISYDSLTDTVYYNCELYDDPPNDDSCLSWVQVPGPVADTMIIEHIIVQYVDTNLVNIEDGIFTAGLCGDFDGNGTVLDIADLVYLVEYMFGNPPGPEPVVLSAVDVDGSGEVNIADLVYIVDYMFNFGPPPGCP